MQNLLLFLFPLAIHVAFAIHFVSLWADGANADSDVLVETWVASLLCNILSLICVRRCWGTKKSYGSLAWLLVVDFCILFDMVGNICFYEDIFGW